MTKYCIDNIVLNEITVLTETNLKSYLYSYKFYIYVMDHKKGLSLV